MWQCVSLNFATFVFGCTHQLLLCVHERRQHVCMWCADSVGSMMVLSMLNWCQIKKKKKIKNATSAYGYDLDSRTVTINRSAVQNLENSGHSVAQ